MMGSNGANSEPKCSDLYLAIRFLYQENDALLVALGNLDPVASFADQVRNIDDRQWVGAEHFELIARLQWLQRLSCFQGRQRTFQSGKIELLPVHLRKMALEQAKVNAEPSQQAGIGKKPDALPGIDLSDGFTELDQTIGIDQRR